MTSFSEMNLGAPLGAALAAAGYSTPTPIQAQAIPLVAAGRDVLGIAQTGTGKTAAFALPMILRLSQARKRPLARHARALVLAPTRELAAQINDCFVTFGKPLQIRSTAIFGGVGERPQIAAMAGGMDVLVATPGRLLDLMEQGAVRLDAVEICVLDEADRMLDMGFVREVRRIVQRLPKQRQTLLFSATMPPAVTELAEGLLTRHARVEVTPVATTAEKVEQRVLFVERADKRILLSKLLAKPDMGRTIVFARTKHGANKIAEYLAKTGHTAEAIHGNKSQGARQRALDGFRSGRVRTLVATDIAARGIDVEDVTHVINFELPNEPESYVHRIGRTARAGKSGMALSLCDAEELPYLKAIEKTIRQPVAVLDDHDFHADHLARLHQSAARPAANANAKPRSRRRRKPAAA